MVDFRLELLSKQLKQARKGKKLSQLKAGRAIYRSDRKIRFFEQGQQVPDLIEFLALMEAYGTDATQFLAQFLTDLQERYQAEKRGDHGSEEPVSTRQILAGATETAQAQSQGEAENFG